MVDAFPPPSPLFLREAEVRRGIELLYFGYSSLIKRADERLAGTPYGRAHHRALYFIARQPGLTVSALLRLLDITKQSLGRVLTDLQDGGLVEQKVGARDRRQRLLYLTEAGRAFEAELFDLLRQRMAAAYAEAGQQAVGGFWTVLNGLLPAELRTAVGALQGDQA
jgi:DNA-binding MarR family transcriptional regulator